MLLSAKLGIQGKELVEQKEIKLCFTCNLGECVNRRKQGEIILLAAEVELIPRREIRVREKLRNIYHGDER